MAPKANIPYPPTSLRSEPAKTIVITKEINIDIPDYSTFEELVNFLSKNHSLKNVFIEKCIDEHGYLAWQFVYTEENINPNYDSQIEDYRKAVEKYNKEYQEYLIKKAEYDKQQKENYLNGLKTQREDLDKKIKELEENNIGKIKTIEIPEDCKDVLKLKIDKLGSLY